MYPTHLNSSLLTTVFLSIWKEAEVIALLKEGNRIDFQSPFQTLLWRASLPLWKIFLSLAARQISPVEKSTGDVIVYIAEAVYIIGHYQRNLKIILYSQDFLLNKCVLLKQTE